MSQALLVKTPCWMDFGTRLREIRARKRLSQKELGLMLGLSRSKVNDLEHGRYNPDPDTVKRAEQIDGDRTTDVPTGREVKGPFALRPTPMIKMRVVGSASAGDGVQSDSEEDFVYVPVELAGQKTRVAWVVEGDSMYPWLEPSDVIVIEEHRSQKVGLAFLVYDEAERTHAVKKLDYQDGEFVLVSVNPKYPPRIMKPTERLMGYVVGLYRVDGSTHTIISDDHGLRPR